MKCREDSFHAACRLTPMFFRYIDGMMEQVGTGTRRLTIYILFLASTFQQSMSRWPSMINS
ncbi:hypothetical protein M707_24780 [Arthrobacter sp. AK-YN10]|nr:hypothetical protein M707_24780 [Arthrobacter sp. AK-YN10]QSZ52357.1 hypothetical protein AYX19_04635 [Paenarthrobacter ureafaciens]